MLLKFDFVFPLLVGPFGIFWTTCDGFLVNPATKNVFQSNLICHSSKESAIASEQHQQRKNVVLLLLDPNENDLIPQHQFLPMSFLPTNVSATLVHDITITRSMYDAIDKQKGKSGRREFGQIAARAAPRNYLLPQSTSLQQQHQQHALIHAIGCSVEILGAAKVQSTYQKKAVSCRGGFRFIVKDIVQTVPHIVAIVDEYVDDIIDDGDGDNNELILFNNEFIKSHLVPITQLSLLERLKIMFKYAEAQRTFFNVFGTMALLDELEAFNSMTKSCTTEDFFRTLKEQSISNFAYFILEIFSDEATNEMRRSCIAMANANERLLNVHRLVNSICINQSRKIMAESENENKNNNDGDGTIKNDDVDIVDIINGDGLVVKSAIKTESSKSNLNQHNDGKEIAFVSPRRLRKNVVLSLLDPNENNEDENVASQYQFFPLFFLPSNISAAIAHDVVLTQPFYEAVVEGKDNNGRREFGQIIARAPPSYDLLPQQEQQQQNALIHAIGCSVEVLGVQSDGTNETRTVSCRGGFRFIVKKVMQTVPHVVAIVDEYVDDIVGDGDIGDDEEYGDDGITLSNTFVKKNFVSLVQLCAQLQLKTMMNEVLAIHASNSTRSGYITRMEILKIETFNSLIETCITEDFFRTLKQQSSANLAFFVLELCYDQIGNTKRRDCLVTTNTNDRWRVVVSVLKSFCMKRYQEFNKDDGDDRNDQDNVDRKGNEDGERETIRISTDLQVSSDPSFPTWARQLQKGQSIEYYWNEEYGWCRGTIVDEPKFLFFEVLLPIQFANDDEIYILPLNAEEKVRWRPA